jgi:hypothetical protein
LVPKCTDDGDFDAIEKPENYIARFAFPVRPVNHRRSIEDEAHLIEVDSPLAQNSIALVVVPTK